MKTTLNANADGPFAFSDPEMIAQWERTMHCIEGVIENHEMNAATGDAIWSVWTFNGPQNVYLENNEVASLDTGPTGVGKRGAIIIAQCVQFADVDTELPDRLMNEWANNIRAFDKGRAQMMAIVEINGRFTCLDCGHVWSAMLGDDEIPSHCECEQDQGLFE